MMLQMSDIIEETATLAADDMRCLPMFLSLCLGAVSNAANITDKSPVPVDLHPMVLHFFLEHSLESTLRTAVLEWQQLVSVDVLGCGKKEEEKDETIYK